MHHEELSRHYSAGQTASGSGTGCHTPVLTPEGFAQLIPVLPINGLKSLFFILRSISRLSSGMFSRTLRRKPVRPEANKCVFRQVITVTRFRSGIPEWVP